jgi:hypothetical protein
MTGNTQTLKVNHQHPMGVKVQHTTLLLCRIVELQHALNLTTTAYVQLAYMPLVKHGPAFCRMT